MIRITIFCELGHPALIAPWNKSLQSHIRFVLTFFLGKGGCSFFSEWSFPHKCGHHMLFGTSVASKLCIKVKRLTWVRNMTYKSLHSFKATSKVFFVWKRLWILLHAFSTCYIKREKCYLFILAECRFIEICFLSMVLKEFFFNK